MSLDKPAFPTKFTDTFRHPRARIGGPINIGRSDVQARLDSRLRGNDKNEIVNFVGKSSSQQHRLAASQPKATQCPAKRVKRQGPDENKERPGHSSIRFRRDNPDDRRMRVVSTPLRWNSDDSQHLVQCCCRRPRRELADADPTIPLDDRSHFDRARTWTPTRASQQSPPRVALAKCGGLCEKTRLRALTRCQSANACESTNDSLENG